MSFLISFADCCQQPKAEGSMLPSGKPKSFHTSPLHLPHLLIPSSASGSRSREQWLLMNMQM